MSSLFFSKRLKVFSAGIALSTSLLFSGLAAAAEPLKIGYSDWPGWVAWQVAIEKGWFKEAGVDVKFDWFDYAASMNAFTAMLSGDDSPILAVLPLSWLTTTGAIC